VLDAVNLEVDRGELMGLIGPNGAGKTTVLRAIVGLVTPEAGTVLVDGRRPTPGRPAVGYVPQSHDVAWDFPITVADAVMTGLTGRGGRGGRSGRGWRAGALRRPGADAWRAVAGALAQVGMADLAGRPVAHLSGGQRQRVLLARALAPAPALLLLDEPFTGLDLPTSELLATLFADLARQGHALVMTTHDILAALDTCHRIALLNRTIVAIGTPSELTADLDPWITTFHLKAGSALLRALKTA
jgi:manganese/iron transport system ATP-binding protein